MLSEQAVRKIMACYRQGLTLRRIAAACGVSHETIRTALGGAVRRRPHIKMPEKELVALLKSGERVTVLAQKLGVSKSAVYYQAEKRGINVYL